MIFRRGAEVADGRAVDGFEDSPEMRLRLPRLFPSAPRFAILLAWKRLRKTEVNEKRERGTWAR